MVKSTLLGIVAMVAMAGQAYGQGTPMSIHLENVGGPGDTLVMGPVPAGGFVLTDVVAGTTAALIVVISERVDPGAPSTPIFRAAEGSSTTDGLRVHLQSGVPFEPGKYIYIDTDSLGGSSFTLSGYIPSSGFVGGVPAVGTIGLVVMVCMLLGAGGMVLRKRVVA